jgi:hypothetical protein
LLFSVVCPRSNTVSGIAEHEILAVTCSDPAHFSVQCASDTIVGSPTRPIHRRIYDVGFPDPNAQGSFSASLGIRFQEDWFSKEKKIPVQARVVPTL